MKIRLSRAIVVLGFLFSITVGQLFAQSPKEEQLIESYSKEKDPEKKFRRLIRLGEYYQEFDLHKADSVRSELLRQSRVFSDSLRFAALVFSADVNGLSGRSEAQFKDILACQSFLNRIKSDEVQYEIYKRLGYYHGAQQEIETSIFYLNFSLRTANKLKEKEKIAEAHRLLGLSFMLNDQKDSATYHADMSIQFARRSVRKDLLASCFNTQSTIFNHFGQIEIAVAKNILALQIATEINDRYKMAWIAREIGVSQLMIDNLRDAEHYFRLSHDQAKAIRDDRQTALALSNLGLTYFKKNNFEAAIDSNEKALKILERFGDKNGMGDAHNTLGLVYQEKKDFAKAANHFNQSLVYFEGSGNKEKIAAVYHNVGYVFHQQNKYDKALHYLNRSLEVNNVGQSALGQRVKTYREISEVYSDLGQKNKALEYLQLYLHYVDSNSSLQTASKIAELSELYRAEQRDRLILSQADSIERQRQEKELTASKLENVQLRNSFQLYILAGFIIIVVLAGLSLFYRWNQSKIIQQQREIEMAQTLLRAQMNPHFVFNAMSVIQSYIYDNDTENSSRFLVNFSRLMRLILENSSKEAIPVDIEQEILQKYLETQKLRFGERFEFSIDIEERLIQDMALIPPMITQPFIENSIEHGQLHTIEGGFIHVSFRKVDEMLQITIEDNGIGRKGSELSKKSKDHKSMAMKITSDRIENLNKKYKTEGHLQIEDFDKLHQTGTKVLISLPYRTENQTN